MCPHAFTMIVKMHFALLVIFLTFYHHRNFLFYCWAFKALVFFGFFFIGHISFFYNVHSNFFFSSILEKKILFDRKYFYYVFICKEVLLINWMKHPTEQLYVINLHCKGFHLLKKKPCQMKIFVRNCNLFLIFV